MAARGTGNPAPPEVNAIERTRSYRKPIIDPFPYRDVTPAQRPLGPLAHCTRGSPLELKVNWFRIKFPAKPLKVFIYEAIVERERFIRGKGKVYARVTDPFTISTIVYTTVHKCRHVFVNRYRVVFDDFEFLFTPDELPHNGLSEMPLTYTTLDKNREVRYRIRIKRHPNNSFNLRFSEDLSDLDAQWSKIFIKLLLSQNARYIPPDLRESSEQSIHSRFAHFGGGMYYIPTAVNKKGEDITKIETRLKKIVQAGVQAWMGIYASCRQLEDGDPVINFGLTNKFFVTLNLNLIDFYKATISLKSNVEIERTAVMTPAGVDDFTRRLKGLRVKCEWVPDKDKNDYVVGRVERHPKFVKAMQPNQCAADYFMITFDPIHKRKRRVRMDEWYAEMGKPLRYPNLPLCEVSSGKKTHLLPMEVLLTYDKPQKFTKQLDYVARLELATKLTRNPKEHHFCTNMTISKELQYDTDPFMNGMDVNLNHNMVEVTARVLHKIPISAKDELGEPIKETPNTETGEFPVRKAYESTEKEIIFVVCKATDRVLDEDIRSFHRGLAEKCKSRGLTVSDKELFRNVGRDGVSSCIEEVRCHVTMRNLQDNEIPVFLIFAAQDDRLYGEIKLMSDINYQVVTQVITDRTVIKMRSTPETELSDYKTIYHNIFLKLNAKLGGINQTMDFEESLHGESRLPSHEKTMFIGIDAIHPSPNSPIRSFSIAAIVGSTDKNATKYVDRIMVNPNCNETIQNFEYHFHALLQEYSEQRRELPERVIVLRDGVSDSEMIQAAGRELQSLKNAWIRSAAGVERPPFTYIVVQKRHKTRFYRRDVDQEGGNANPFPGTVVSEGAVSPHKFDFYMISHRTPEGTSRPAHYTVVVDESNYSTDEITEMCFRLCCLYARCSKPVSIPTPVYYAHLKCKRAALQFQYAASSRQLAEIDDIGQQESPQAYKERVINYVMKIEKALNRDPTERKIYPGMNFV